MKDGKACRLVVKCPIVITQLFLLLLLVVLFFFFVACPISGTRSTCHCLDVTKYGTTKEQEAAPDLSISREATDHGEPVKVLVFINPGFLREAAKDDGP